MRRIISFSRMGARLLIGNLNGWQTGHSAFLFACLLMLWPNILLAQSGERITSYQADIQVNTDRTVELTEIIEINVLGQAFKHGLLRDVPVRYQDKDGLPVYLDFRVISIRRDGKDEPFQLTHQGRYARLRIGDADVFLSHGLHRYEIRYQVNNSIGFFEDHDELYWNAVGNEWGFWIDRARISVTLPQEADIDNRFAVYTGKAGSKGRDYEILGKTANRLKLRSTRALAPGEGITVAVGWQKGVIAPPTKAEMMADSVRDNSPLFILLVGVIVQLSWLYWAWLRVGKDPDGGAIIPRYRAPKDLSPVVAAYVSGLGAFKEGLHTGFMAALINLAIKGFVTIEDNDKDLSVRRDRNINDVGVNSLPVGERALFSSLMVGRDIATFADMKFKTMAGIMEAFAGAVETETDQVYFRRNRAYMVPGFLLAIVSVVGFVIASIALAPPFTFPFFEVIVACAIAGLVAVLRAIGLTVMGERKLHFGKGGIFVLFIVIFIGSIAVGEIDQLYGSYILLFIKAALICCMLLSLVFFASWMKAPTKLGREVMDEVEGLKLFMTVTAAQQASEMEAVGLPELTPKLYEDLLPYAIALGIERTWSAIFEDKVFSQLPPEAAYNPHWYHGSQFNPSRPTAALAAMTDTLGTDLSSAMTPPASSSSGSSGGGFSGGGGGGGGGGGW